MGGMFMAAYLALVRRHGAQDYAVEFPDFPHCVLAAASLEEAERRARLALPAHIDRLIADNEWLPHPSVTDADAFERADPEVTAFLVEAGQAGTGSGLDRPANENTLERFVEERMGAR